MSNTKRATPPTPMGEHEARLGDRGDASGRNIEQNRAIGQDDPADGSRKGRAANKESGFPGTPDIGTNAGQVDKAKD